MLPALATLEQFDTWPGVTIAEGEEESAEAVLAAASTRVRAYTGETYVDEEGDLVEDIPDAVGQVVVMAAARVWADPSMRLIGETLGSSSQTYDRALTGLVLTDEEKAMLGGSSSGTSGLWALRTTRGDLETRPVSACWPFDETEDEG